MTRVIDLGGHVLSRVTEADVVGLRSLHALLEEDPASWAALEGAPPRANEAALMLEDLPPGVTAERKFVWVARDVVIDIVEGYPDPTTWYLGLLFIAPLARGRGLGTTLLRELAAHVKRQGGTALRLAVVTTNVDARRLYDRMGFLFVARRTRPLWTGGSHECDVLELRL